MAANAGTKCYKVLENVKMLMAIELLTACQALEFRKPFNIHPELENIFIKVRDKIPYMAADRLLHDDLVLSQELINELVSDKKF